MATQHFAITRQHAHQLRMMLRTLPDDNELMTHDMNMALHILSHLLQSCEDKEWVKDVEAGLRTDVDLIYNYDRCKWSFSTENAGHFMVTSNKKAEQQSENRRKYLKDTYSIE